MKTRRWLLVFVGLILLCCGALVYHFVLFRATPYDEALEREGAPSRDLAADRRAMWRTVPAEGSNFEVSPVSAN